MDRYEANIFLPSCAWVALEELRATTRLSRDRQVRELVEQYVETYSSTPRDVRLTHISTVIWHPETAVGRGRPRADSYRLRLRLPTSLAEAAQGLALRLPGQHIGPGGHHDYRSRSHADAFLTALSAQITFSDDVLDGLPPLITQAAAIGLFRLAVAATASETERRIFLLADSDLPRVRTGGRRARTPDLEGQLETAQDLAAILRDEEDIAWHGRWRRTATRHLARQLLAGPDAARWELALHDQGEDFGLLREQFEHDRHQRSEELIGLSKPDQDWEGRGGTAVWRARRILTLRDLVTDLADANSSAASVGAGLRVESPGWRLAMPERWRAVVARGPLGPSVQRYVNDAITGRVLQMRSGSRHVFWPYMIDGQGAVATIAGVQAVLAAAGDLEHRRVAEAILVQLDSDTPYAPLGSTPAITAAEALSLGFIDETKRSELEEAARDRTRARMAHVIDAAHEENDREELRATLGDAEAFATVARRLHVAFAPVRPWCAWPRSIISIAAELDAGMPDAHVRVLVPHLLSRFNWVLERTQEHAWRAAFDTYRPINDVPDAWL